MDNLGSGYCVAIQLINPTNDFEGIDKFWCIKKDSNELICLSPEEYQSSIDSDIQDKEQSANLSLLYPYQSILHAVFSPDGNYLLLNTSSTSVEGRSRNLFLVRLEDMTIKPITGLNAEDINVGAMGANYAINIEWNTNELIIGTKDGIKTFTFSDGQ